MSSPNNSERARWASEALGRFRDITGMRGEDTQTVMSDLLCNLMHLAAEGGADFETALRNARANYDAEKTGNEW